ncbi:MAG: hypothetical protein WAQ24_05080 [Candidatus Saccharimonadales bacterium]
MPARSYIQQAAGAMRKASQALKADAQNMHKVAEAEKRQYHDRAHDATQKRNAAVALLAAADSHTETDIVRRKILESEKVINESEEHVKRIDAETAQKMNAAESAAHEAESLAGAIERLLGQSGYE